MLPPAAKSRGGISPRGERMSESQAQNGGRLALLIDLERCTGCKSCEVACKQEHRLGPGEYRNKVVWTSGVEDAGLAFLTLTCQHCERPACVRACPVNPKAIEKDAVTGVVSVVESRCTGCGECVIACPYSAMGYDPKEHHAVKCDLCADRRAQGQTTACASVCPTQAIRFGQRDELLAQSQREERAPRDQDHFLLGPATIYLERMPAQNAAGAAHVPARVAPAAGRRAAFMDEVTAQAAVAATKPAFPYGLPREEATADRVVAGDAYQFAALEMELGTAAVETDIAAAGNDAVGGSFFAR